MYTYTDTGARAIQRVTPPRSGEILHIHVGREVPRRAHGRY